MTKTDVKSLLSTIVILGLFSTPSHAVHVYVMQDDSPEDRYAECAAIAQQAPDKGINAALEWQLQGGGVPARHCEALGLFFAKEYAEAAIRLENIAEDMRIGRGMPIRDGKRLTARASTLADTFAQASNAWLLAKNYDNAMAAIDQALSLAPEKSTLERTLRVDRARIAAADEDYGLALSELEAVAKAAPLQIDILIFLASAARAMENYSRADTALSRYLKVHPNDPAAYLELGNLRDAEGRQIEARKAWLKVLSITEVGPDAEAARKNLARIDVKR